jgi:hypothetical protein
MWRWLTFELGAGVGAVIGAVAWQARKRNLPKTTSGQSGQL